MANGWIPRRLRGQSAGRQGCPVDSALGATLSVELDSYRGQFGT